MSDVIERANAIVKSMTGMTPDEIYDQNQRNYDRIQKLEAENEALKRNQENNEKFQKLEADYEALKRSSISDKNKISELEAKLAKYQNKGV